MTSLSNPKIEASKAVAEITKASKAQANSDSLKTTIPPTIRNLLNIQDKDELVWEPIIKNNKVVGAEVRKA